MTAFASAVKNLTIYPASHPRVLARAQEFTTLFEQQNCEACEMILGGRELLVDGKPLPSDHLALKWLSQRARETGLRGIRIERHCRADDVVLFAQALVACRASATVGLADTWDHPEAHVKPLALVVGEGRADGKDRTSRAAGNRTQTADMTAVGDSIAEKLEYVAQSESVQSLLRQIELAGGGDTIGAENVNLLEMIGQLLPVDGPTGIDELTATVEQILARVQGEMHQVIRQHTRIRGAELLRSAVGLARTYFGRAAPEEKSRPELPTGRPEDARIVADLEALLAEYEALPRADGLRLPSSEPLDGGSPAVMHELLGACLHSLKNASEPVRRRARLRLIAGLIKRYPEGLAEVLDTYLTATDDEQSLPIATRLSMLSGLVEGGLTDLLAARGYLDEEILQAGFPEVLRIAANAFTTEEDFARMRRALDLLKPVLQNGGTKAAADSGLLDDENVARLLARTGGDAALALLSQCESDAPGLLAVLAEFAQTLECPPAESAVLRVCSGHHIPPYFLRRLLRAADKHKFDDALRRASGELLREHVESHRLELPLDELCEAISALETVPSDETEQLLRRLRATGRFLNFGTRARATRAAASKSLATLDQRKTI